MSIISWIVVICISSGFAESFMCRKAALPNSVDRHRLRRHSIRHGDYMIGHCKANYMPSSAFRIRCQKNDDGLPKWGHVPCTLVTCSFGMPPLGGSVSFSGGGRIGSMAHFTCHNGVEYEGTNPRECQSDGLWSGSDGRCRMPFASLPVPLPDGVKVNNDGHNWTFWCDNQDFVYTGINVLPVQNLAYTLGICVPKNSISCTIPQINNAEPLEREAFGYNEKYTIRCVDGYLYTGGLLTCSATGKMIGHKGRCVRLRCPDVNRISLPRGLSVATSDGEKFKDVVHLRMNNGLNCSGTVVCLESGEWSKLDMRCSEKLPIRGNSGPRNQADVLKSPCAVTADGVPSSLFYIRTLVIAYITAHVTILTISGGTSI